MFAEFYPWIKALHIVAVISWMAGLLYLPRLFVYHCRAEAGVQSETFKVMEERLLRVIMRPAMIATWGLGLMLVFVPEYQWWQSGWWIYGKIILVVLLTGFHDFLSRCAKAFAKDANARDEKFFRIINEVPTVLMIAIVILVVVKPF